MNFKELKKTALICAERSKLPVNLELDKWPVYVELGDGPILPLTRDMVFYGFVGGASALIIDISTGRNDGTQAKEGEGEEVLGSGVSVTPQDAGKSRRKIARRRAKGGTVGQDRGGSTGSGDA